MILVFTLVCIAQCTLSVNAWKRKYSDNDCGPYFSKHTVEYYLELAEIIADKTRFTQVYFINGSREGQQFVLCTTPKAGSTRTKVMMEKIIPADGGFREFCAPSGPYVGTPLLVTTIGYERSDNITFKKFIDVVYNRKEEKKSLDKHFMQQSHHCRLHMGMAYDYILKIEEMNEWFDCFMDKVNIRKEMMQGEECYLSTTRSPCFGPSMSKSQLILTNNKAMGHESVIKLDDYYDEETKNQVADLFFEDFINFNYSLKFENI
eukprot:TRINITY_DN50_c1_g1_i4.p1 TRINITY_DN50_c1_g1~~TRINITY_DN50_c1_g1_i4.p1  ORF type:complete len:262 (-),score=17.00 TRINITY_DN50_c1_g1_i4:355-1140(-)